MCKTGKAVEELDKKFPCEETGFDVSLLSEDMHNTIRQTIDKWLQEKAENDKKSIEELNNKTGLELLISYVEDLMIDKATEDKDADDDG